MKRVTLFKVVLEELMVADTAVFYEQMHMPELSSMRVIGAADEIACSPVGTRLTIPIRKHMRRTELTREYLALCGQGHLFRHPEEGYKTEETYIAIDPAAEIVLGVEMVRIEALESHVFNLKTDMRVQERQIDELCKENGLLKSAGFFTILKWLFRGVSV